MARLVTVLGVLLLVLAACGGGGGDGPVTEPMPPPEQDDRIRDAQIRALIALADARLEANDAYNACAASQAACEAADTAEAAYNRASAAADAADAATTVAEAERAATAAEQARMEAEAAADIARDIAAVDPVGPGQPMVELPAVPFTLEPGTEIRLAEEVFLVCPSGGLQCHIQDLTQDAAGDFEVQLAQVSDQPFFWFSSSSLFTGDLQPLQTVYVRSADSNTTHKVTCVQSTTCKMDRFTHAVDGGFDWPMREVILHVTKDETGFFLENDQRVVTFSDGATFLIECPTRCGINRLYIDENGTHFVEWDRRWGEPEQKEQSDNGIDDSNQGQSQNGDDDDAQNQAPREPTPLVQTSDYSSLPVDLPKFSVNHWEMTDSFTVSFGSTRPRQISREEVICPGRPPDGNVCEIKGKRRKVAELLEQIDGRIMLFGPPVDGYYSFGIDALKVSNALIKKALGGSLTEEEKVYASGFQTVGKWGQYSAYGELFFIEDVSAEELNTSAHYFAFGHLYDEEYGGMPTPKQGSGIWRGDMWGIWNNLNEIEAGGVVGTSELEYDFSDNTLDLTLMITDVVLGNQFPYHGQRMLKWSDIKQNRDGSFFVNGNHEAGIHPSASVGMLDGDFYGPEAQEMAGIFERILGNYHLQGVFGGKRQ